MSRILQTIKESTVSIAIADAETHIRKQQGQWPQYDMYKDKGSGSHPLAIRIR